MREWLTVIIVLLILGILLDGMRRMRAHRRDHLRMKRRVVARADQESAEPEPGGSEFPSGGARVAAYRDPDHALSVNKSVKENHTASRWTRGGPGRIPEQVSLKLDTPVPMLMDSVEEQARFSDDLEPRIGDLTNLEDDGPNEHPEPVLGSETDFDPYDDHLNIPVEPAEIHRREAPEPYETADAKKAYEAVDAKKAHETADVRKPYETPDARKPYEMADAKKPREMADIKKTRETVDAKKPREVADAKSPRETAETPKPPDEVLIINVMAHRGEFFGGPDLLEAMLSQGMRYGEMDIFHRHESADGRGRVLFSAANMVVPGTFDLTGMDDFTTPGISMFLSLPIASDSLSAYNLMVSTAQAIAEALNGELKDENRSVMTRQTIEHGRQRVIEYERKRRLAKT